MEQEFHRIKRLPPYVDYGVFTAIQVAATAAPGLGFGEYGEGFVRLGLVENRQRIRQALRSVKTMLREDGGAAGAARRLAS